MTPPRIPAFGSPTNGDERPQDAPEKLTPAAWADRLGFIKRHDPRLPQSEDVPHWKHAAADKLFGWSEHAYHFQAKSDAFAITEAEYRAALDAAADYPACAELPTAAITPSKAKAFEGFKPARNLKAERKASAEAAAKAQGNS